VGIFASPRFLCVSASLSHIFLDLLIFCTVARVLNSICPRSRWQRSRTIGLSPFPQVSTIISNPTPPANPFPRPTCTPPSQIAHVHSSQARAIRGVATSSSIHTLVLHIRGDARAELLLCLVISRGALFLVSGLHLCTSRRFSADVVQAIVFPRTRITFLHRLCLKQEENHCTTFSFSTEIESHSITYIGGIMPKRSSLISSLTIGVLPSTSKRGLM